jgi:hypothetical protein
MIPHRVTLQDIGPFTDLVDVDIDALAHGIVAIDGNNGTGKTVFAESIVAGVHRRFPSYGTLADLATSRDAYLQLEFSTKGRRWKARHEIGKGKVFLYNDRGAVLDKKGSVDAFGEWVDDNCLPLDVITASWCIPQESRGFIGMERGERKSVVLQAMGSTESERLAERARKRAKALERDLVEVSRNVDAERGRFLPVDEAEAALRLAVERQAKADEIVSGAASALQDARAHGAAWEMQLRQHREATAAYARAVDRVTACQARLVSLDARIAEQRGLIAKGDMIRVRVAEDVEVQRVLAQAKTNYEEARLAAIAAGDATDAAHRTRSYVGIRLDDTRKLLGELDEIILGKADAEKAADEALAMAARIDTLTSDIAELDEEIRKIVAGAVGQDGEVSRVNILREGLGSVVHQAKTIAAARKTAEGVLRADDIAWANVGPWRLSDKQEQREELIRQRRDLGEQLSKLEQRASMITTITKAESGREKVVANLATLVVERDQADAALSTTQEAQRRAKLAHAEAGVALSSASEAARLNEPWKAQVGRLDQAEALVVELDGQRAVLVGDLTAAEEEVAQTPQPGEVAPHPAPISQLEQAHRRAVAEAQEATVNVVRYEEALRLAGESAERVAKLREREQALGDEVRDTATLAEALGSSGIQALLVDAAGPELTQGMNELLHEAIGPRWTVSVETTQLDSKGKRELEAFNIMVTDAEAPADRRTRESKLHCGGERVYITEALATTLAGMSGRRFDHAGGTLIRDEASAALRGYNIARWFDLLRLGMRMNGMARALVVTHHPEALDLADQVIEFADGTVRVVR